METGTTALADLKAEVEAMAGGAYLKAILWRAGDGWNLYHARALIGIEPPGWAEQTWRYEKLAFAACVLPAAELATLCAAEGSTIILAGLPISVPGARGPANWTRRPSFAWHDHWQSAWPATDYRIAAADEASRQLPHAMLVGEGPSFPEPQNARHAFCEGDFSLTGAGALPQEWRCSGLPGSTGGSAVYTSRPPI